MSHLLGPQCLTCKKRQVKCDSREPLCQRCENDGRECRGYKHDLKIVVYQPQHRNNSDLARRTQRRLPTSRLLLQENETAISRTPNRRPSPTDTLPALPRPIPSDHDYLALLESLRYYETHVLPYTIAPGALVQRVEIDRTIPWHILPKILIHCMILSLRTMRVSAYSPDPQSRHDICYYRGLSLSGVQKALDDAVSDPDGVALGCVLLLMGADLSISPGGSWTTHFEAARRIVYLRGGMARCLRELPASRNLLVTFMVTDIVSGTTCPARELRSRYCLLSQYGSLVEDMQLDMLRQGFLCPAALLKAISRINLLRAGKAEPHCWDDLRGLVTAFDACQTQWATDILQESGNVSQHESATLLALTSLGRCYQLATLLYLELTRSGGSLDLDAPGCKAELDHNIRVLFNFAKADEDGSLHGQLWKFVLWPLFVSAYVEIGWSFSHGFCAATSPTRTVQIEKIRTIGITQGSARLVVSAQALHEILLRRIHQRSWEWDDGFPARHSFAL